jgi:HAD superfamily hydrolase (TIGR01509 family)
MLPGLVIFDNDGVLVDSERIACSVLAELLTAVGVPTTLDDALDVYMGGSLGRVHEIVLARDGISLPASFDDDYHARLFATFDTDLQPVDGVAAVLDRLDARGVPYVVASSGTHERIARALRLTGLAERFDGRVYSAQDVVRGKPAPDLFVYAARGAGVDPSACVVIEDSPLGVSAARAAGMRVLGHAALTPRERLAEADELFGAMAELPALLGLD